MVSCICMHCGTYEIAGKNREKSMTSETTEKQDAALQRRSALRNAARHFGLILAVICYTFLGAALFQALEQGNETVHESNLRQEKELFLEKLRIKANASLWQASDLDTYVNGLLNVFAIKVSEAIKLGVDVQNMNAVNSTSKWDFWGSMLFSMTVYTSIGYGHIAPMTSIGRIATIIYATVGIPLCLILLADLGRFNSRNMKGILIAGKRAIYSCKHAGELEIRWPRNQEIEKLEGISVFVCVCVIIVLYMFAGAALYRIWEDWEYLDAFYFIFISTSTIGFGDVLPEHPKYFLIASVYIFFGLSLISTAFALLQDIMQTTIKKAQVKLDARLGLESLVGQEEELKVDTAVQTEDLNHKN